MYANAREYGPLTVLWPPSPSPSPADEPPEVQPDSIHGPVLLTAEDFKNEEYVQVRRGWGEGGFSLRTCSLW